VTADPNLPAHSLLGASAMHRWMHCPGSFALSQQAPPGRSSIYAATGTLAHSFIEGTLRETLKAEGHLDPAMMHLDEILLGATYQVEGHDIVIDEDFLEGVNVMLEYLADTAPAYDMVQCERTVHLDRYFRTPPPVPMFGRTDVVLVVGANDVVNPDARTNEGSPIYGMPILNVDQAQTVVVLKRSMNPGFAGIENPLFFNPKTVMLFGDAKESIGKLIEDVKAV
jgi:hypothetical protein